MTEARYDELCHTVAKLWREVWLAARRNQRTRRGRLLFLIMKIEHRLAHSVRLAG